MNEINIYFAGLLVYLLLYPVAQGILFGSGLWLFLSAGKQDKSFMQGLFGGVTILGCGVPLGCFFLYLMNYSVKEPLSLWALVAIGSLFLMFYFERKGVVEKILKMGSKTSDLERDKKTDVRQVLEKMKKMQEYDPEPYFRKNAYFFGLDANKKPVYWEKPRLPHLQISGASGFGKSVLLGLTAAQTLRKGEATIIFDPKKGGDEFFPHVARDAAQKAKVNFNFIDLRSTTFQLNPFKDASELEITELLKTSFEIFDVGDASDFYRPADRKAAQRFAELYEEGDTARSMLSKHYSVFEKLKAVYFLEKLEELASVNALNAVDGLSLKDAIEQGDLVYIAGDTDSDIVKMAQRMLLARVLQIASARDNITETPRQLCIILDEFKFHISRLVMTALSTIRDKGVHIVFAHQAIADLKDVPKSLDGEAVKGAILTNCTLKFTYRAVDVETADYFSDLSGEVLVDDEIRHVDRSLSLADKVSAERQVRQTERNYIDRNTMLFLPENCGVLFGNGLARISNVYPIKVQKNPESKQVQDFGGDMELKPIADFDTL